ncbi:MAG: basic amino acid/polyamine antiporter, family, partial [Thermoplasmata archaeon]|nr:basic amino acid/polyamine antiporter, family [Thermoplasmata archaeon]
MTLVKPPSVTSPDPTAGVDGEVRLAREITFLDATMLGVGALMGGGVFVLLGIAAGVSGPALILALFFNGFITIPTLLVYAELGSASDDAGGGYLWAKEGLGQPFGFLGGWLGWFSHVIACSLYALA